MTNNRETAEAEFDEWWALIGTEMVASSTGDADVYAERVARQAWKDAIGSYIYQNETET